MIIMVITSHEEQCHMYKFLSSTEREILFIFFKSSLADTPPLTEVHKLLVSKHHLSNLTTPTKIKYLFKRTGSLEPGFNDRVVMIVPEKDDKGVHNIKFDFFSSYNKEDIRSASYKKNNPIFHAF